MLSVWTNGAPVMRGYLVLPYAYGRVCVGHLFACMRTVESKETYCSVKRDLLQCQKRPTAVSKETYCSVKRDLLQSSRQKRTLPGVYMCPRGHYPACARRKSRMLNLFLYFHFCFIIYIFLLYIFFVLLYIFFICVHAGNREPAQGNGGFTL